MIRKTLTSCPDIAQILMICQQASADPRHHAVVGIQGLEPVSVDFEMPQGKLVLDGKGRYLLRGKFCRTPYSPAAGFERFELGLAEDIEMSYIDMYAPGEESQPDA